MKYKADFVRQNLGGGSVHQNLVNGIVAVGKLPSEAAPKRIFRSHAATAELSSDAQFAVPQRPEPPEATWVDKPSLFCQRLSQIGRAASPNCMVGIRSIWLSSYSRIIESFSAFLALPCQPRYTNRSAPICRRQRDLHNFNRNPVVPRIPR